MLLVSRSHVRRRGSRCRGGPGWSSAGVIVAATARHYDQECREDEAAQEERSPMLKKRHLCLSPFESRCVNTLSVEESMPIDVSMQHLLRLRIDDALCLGSG